MLSANVFRARCAMFSLIGLSVTAYGQDREQTPCNGAVSKHNVVSCALRVSALVSAERMGTLALQARKTAVDTLLPSNPLLMVTGARRIAPAGSGQANATNWSATLSQEVQIAGQRGKRVDVVSAQQEAQRLRLQSTARNVAASAWLAYYEVLSAQEALRVARMLESTSKQMSEATRARAQEGLISTVDADVADVASVRWLQQRMAAERVLARSRQELATLLGRNAGLGVVVDGELTPLHAADAWAASDKVKHLDVAAARPEIKALEADRVAWVEQSRVYRRSRVPSPLINAFVQNDGFNERVYGVGLGIPIPLPQPVGRTFAGEIAESHALARRSEAEALQAKRVFRLDVVSALNTYQSRKAELSIFHAEQVTRAEQSLKDIASEIRAGRLRVQDALLSQQTLMGYLQSYVEVQRAVCIGSVELARAAGLALERGVQ